MKAPNSRSTAPRKPARNGPASQRRPVELPAQPPLTEEEKANRAELREIMDDLIQRLRQRNLDNAVALAQEAARGHGTLVEHFAELGRRFGSSSAPERPKLRVIEGDAS